MALPVNKLNSKFEGEIEFAKRTYGAPYALPGDLVQFQIRRGRKKSFKVVHIERAESYDPSIAIARPFCEYYMKCGGCRGQHLSYKFQLDLKFNPVELSMKEKFNVDTFKLPATQLSSHRHRMDFVVDGEVIGQRPVGDFSKFISIQSCPVQGEFANQALGILQKLILDFPSISFKRTLEEGILKYVTIRSNLSAGLIILTFFEGYENHKDYNAFIENLIQTTNKNLPDFGIVVCESNAKSEVSAPPGGQAIYGTENYIESLGNLSFQVPYDSFFQPNPLEFDKMLNKIFETMDPYFQNTEVLGLIDLYCGNAVLSSIISNRYIKAFSKITGFEFTKSATLGAVNNLNHFHGEKIFYETDLNSITPELERVLQENNNLIILDPPRAGASLKLCNLLADNETTPYMLYISCNPQTQIRDLEILDKNWKIQAACLVDCYPHTPHLEQAVFLKNRHLREQAQTSH